MDSQGDYEGLKIWTLLDGTVIRVNKYSEGKKIASVSMVGVRDVQDYLSRINCAMKMMGKMKIERGESHRSRLTKSLPEEWGEDYYIYYLILQGGVIIYFDGSFVYLDTDGDGIPDEIVGVIEPSIIIEYMSGDGGDSGNPDPDPDPDPAPDPSGNGNDPGGGGGGNNGSGTNSGNAGPVQLSLSGIQYLGYSAEHNCFAVATDLAWQLGANTGSYAETLCYEDQTHTVLISNGNTEDAIETFIQYLQDGLPIVVGVHYRFNYGINDQTVDHWVVIYGYGYTNSGDIYFDYNETNRSVTWWDQTHGDQFRFYYDPNCEWLNADHYVSSGISQDYPKYILTTYRYMTPVL